MRGMESPLLSDKLLAPADAHDESGQHDHARDNRRDRDVLTRAVVGTTDGTGTVHDGRYTESRRVMSVGAPSRRRVLYSVAEGMRHLLALCESASFSETLASRA